jgi:hypothetical protein
VQFPDDAWHVKQQEVQESDRCQEKCGQRCILSNENRYACASEDDPEEISQ